MLREILIFLHIASVIVWVGGMFFAYFCLRPAAAKLLEPPQRLPLWAATFDLFFRYAGISVLLILATGLAMFFQIGFKLAPVGWHIMLTLGLIMSAVFGHVYFALYPRLRKLCEAGTWPAAAVTLNSIRRMVGFNLILSVLTVAAAISAR